MKPRPKPGCIVASHPPRDPTIARSRRPDQSDARIVCCQSWTRVSERRLGVCVGNGGPEATEAGGWSG
jgi:hypothetical protein